MMVNLFYALIILTHLMNMITSYKEKVYFTPYILPGLYWLNIPSGDS
jgi:hypothetical protein